MPTAGTLDNCGSNPPLLFSLQASCTKRQGTKNNSTHSSFLFTTLYKSLFLKVPSFPPPHHGKDGMGRPCASHPPWSPAIQVEILQLCHAKWPASEAGSGVVSLSIGNRLARLASLFFCHASLESPSNLVDHFLSIHPGLPPSDCPHASLATT